MSIQVSAEQMRTLVTIKARIKPASKNDLYTRAEDIIEHQPVFIDHPKEKVLHCFYTHTDEGYLWFWSLFALGIVYVLDFEDDTTEGNEIEMELLPVEGFEIKENNKELKYGMPYYIRTADEMNGPYFFTRTSNPLQVKNYLDSKRLYIVRPHQKVTEVKPNKVAV